ncbi:MAG: Fic family protein [Henriciella sp.]|nr:Fic family protein [Henriciella sp.]
MILFDLIPTEDSQPYQTLQVCNLDRQYAFLNSIVEASISTGRLYLSQAVIKAFNYHAIVCLHADAGQFRPHGVEIKGGKHQPPPWFHVQAQMDDMVNSINRSWDATDPLVLASYALWRLNWIHPFVNGNGRTARVTAYYILCLKFGGLLAGTVSLPELLCRHRHEPDDPYVAALQEVDESLRQGALDFSPLVKLIGSLLEEQLGTAPPPDEAK